MYSIKVVYANLVGLLALNQSTENTRPSFKTFITGLKAFILKE